MIDMLETKPFAMRMTMLTPFYQERLQDGRNQSGSRESAMPSSGKPLETIENTEKRGKPCLALYVVGFVAVVHYLQIEEISVQHV